MALTMSARLTMPRTSSARMTGTRLMLWVVITRAISSTVVSSATLITFLLMSARTSLPFLATISASETMPMILPPAPTTGAPLIWFLISVVASCLTVIVAGTVMISLVMMSLAIIRRFLLESFLGDQRGEIAHPAAITPFIIVPRQHLGHLAVERHRREPVDDRRRRAAAEIARHQRLVAIFQDALERVLRAGSEGVVDRRRAGGLFQIHHQIDHRDRRG